MAIARAVIKRGRFHHVIQHGTVDTRARLLQTLDAVFHLFQTGLIRAGNQYYGCRHSGGHCGIGNGEHRRRIQDHEVIVFIRPCHYRPEAFAHQQFYRPQRNRPAGQYINVAFFIALNGLLTLALPLQYAGQSGVVLQGKHVVDISLAQI